MLRLYMMGQHLSFDGGHDSLSSNPEVLVDLARWCRGAEAVDGDNRAMHPHIAVPAERHAGFDGHTIRHTSRQDVCLVVGRLLLEQLV